MDTTLSLYMNESQSRIIQEAVSRESPRLFRFIRGKVATDEDAQDILQDVFYQLSNNSAIAGSIENMAAWLFRVARNRIIDLYRKKKPESFDAGSLGGEDAATDSYLSHIGAIATDADDNPEALYERNLIWETLYEALTELPEEQRRVFELHELENKSFQEISAMTGVGINTLLSRKRYAVLHLRKKMQQLYDSMLND